MSRVFLMKVWRLVDGVDEFVVFKSNFNSLKWETTVHSTILKLAAKNCVEIKRVGKVSVTVHD